MQHLHAGITGTMWAFLLAGGIVTPKLWPVGPQHDNFAQGLATQAARLMGGKVKFQILPARLIGSPLKINATVQKSVTQAGHSGLGYNWANVALGLPVCSMAKG